MRGLLKKDLYYNEAIWSIGICNFCELNKIQENIMKYPVLTNKDIKDAKALFVADPFIIKKDGKWYMFFEIYDKEKRKGVIGSAISVDGYKWVYEKVVLNEEFHLSYPYIIVDNNKIYMLPETGMSGYVKLYEPVEFPYKWRFIKNIINESLWDPSIFQYENMMWLMAWSNKPNKDCLRLFYSDSILSQWREHPKSPVVNNNKRTSRPAGRVIYENKKLMRYCQDYSDYYGKLVRHFEINKISLCDYEETDLGIVISNSDIKNTWNKNGMHTIDVHKFDENSYIASIDGFYYRKVNKIARYLKSKLNIIMNL